MYFTRFRLFRNATFKLRWRNRVKCIVYTYLNNRWTGKDGTKPCALGHLGQWNPNPVGPSDMTDENCCGPAENISFPDRMSGNVFSDNELKKCPKRFIIKNTISQIVFSCGFIFDSRELTFGTIFLLPYVHDKLYCMKSPMFKTLKWIGFLFATSYMSWALQRPRQVTFGLMFWVTGSSYLTVNSSLALDVHIFQIEIRGGGCPREDLFNTFLNEKDDQDNCYMDGYLDENECLGKFVYVYKGMNVLKLDNICMKSCSTLYATSVVHFWITLSSVCGKYISVNLSVLS